MDIRLYIAPFISSFLVCVAMLSLLVFSSNSFNNFSKLNGSVRKRMSSRLGGIAIIVSFVAALLSDKNLYLDKPILGILMAIGIILFFGIWDDFYNLSWKNQLFSQVAVVLLVFIMGIRVEYVTNPFGGTIDLNVQNFFMPSLFLVMAWIILFMNSMNWIDGIDGLSGGIALVGGLAIFALSFKPEVNQPPVGIIAAALIGSILAFLIFNFNPSKITAGTSGSMFFGFILAVLAIFAGTKIATALLVMTVPIVDAFWVIFERMRSGKSIFESDKRHLHHKLLELGWSQKKICLMFYSITILVAIIALNTRAIGKMITISATALILAGILYLTNKRIYSKKVNVEA